MNMALEYYGTRWLKDEDSFQFPSLLEYITQTRQELSRPMQAPPYAAADENSRLEEVNEKVKADPYLSRVNFHESLRNVEREYQTVRYLSYANNPILYDVCVFTANKLMKLTPMIFLYHTLKPGRIYNASASDYQDKAYIYVSDQFFVEHGMLKPEELCFMIGHELGHVQCHHIYISCVKTGTSNNEYSADRAGLIACTAWIRKERPQYTVEQAIQEAVLYAASLLQKLAIAAGNGPSKTKWSDFDYDLIRKAIDEIFQGASKLTVSLGTHPHTRHRIMAMVHFSQSQLLYRCLGESPQSNGNLYSDSQLQTIMAYLLKAD